MLETPFQKAARLIPSWVIWAAFAYIVWFYFGEMKHGGNIWKTGDWLIDYSGGFVRRGLAGHLLGRLSDSGLPMSWLVFGFQVALFGAVLALVLPMAARAPGGWAWWPLILSPAFLLFPYFDPQGGFRKETLVFLAFALLARACGLRRLGWPIVGLVTLVYGVAVFSHELACLVLPFFVFLLWQAVRDGWLPRERALRLVLLWTGIALAGMLVALGWPGNATVAAKVCDSVKARGFDDAMCTGSIEWLGHDARYGVEQVRRRILRYGVTFVPLGAVALLPVALSAWGRRHWRFLLVAMAALMPLLAVAIDWGRWMHVYVFCVVVTMLARAPHEDLGLYQAPWMLWVPYLLIWSVPHCCMSGPYFGVLGLFMGWDGS